MANFITLFRFPLLFLYLVLLYLGDQGSLLWNTPLILLIFALDGLDGWVARKKGETSLLGSVLDIATDRALEYVLWVVYAHLGLIPVAVPVIVLIRGTFVDAIRSMGMKDGVSAFEQIQSPLSRFLVSSRFMRAFFCWLHMYRCCTGQGGSYRSVQPVEPDTRLPRQRIMNTNPIYEASMYQNSECPNCSTPIRAIFSKPIKATV